MRRYVVQFAALAIVTAAGDAAMAEAGRDIETRNKAPLASKSYRSRDASPAGSR